MPKTYTSVPSVSTGDVYQASVYNTMTAQNLNNLIVPPSLRLNLTANATITNGSTISWSSEAYDTDDMWSSGGTVTIQTAGIYVVSFSGFVSATTLTYAISQVGVSTDRTYFGSAAAILSGNSGYVQQSFIASLSASTTLTFAVAFAATGTVTLSGTVDDATRARAALTWIGRTS